MPVSTTAERNHRTAEYIRRPLRPHVFGLAQQQQKARKSSESPPDKSPGVLADERAVDGLPPPLAWSTLDSRRSIRMSGFVRTLQDLSGLKRAASIISCSFASLALILSWIRMVSQHQPVLHAPRL